MKLRNLLALTAVAGMLLCGMNRQAQAQDMNHTDHHFVRQATWGGMTEVILSHVALDKSNNPDIRAFAQHMIDDHTRANDILLHICGDHGIEHPNELDADHKATVDHIKSLSGWDFNRAYAHQMLDDHTDAVALFQDESANGINEHLRHFADKTLPTLQEHLTMAQDLDHHLHHHDHD